MEKGAGVPGLLGPGGGGDRAAGLLDLRMGVGGSAAPWVLGEEGTGVPDFAV